jgi:hypothetical protein
LDDETVRGARDKVMVVVVVVVVERRRSGDRGAETHGRAS